jgi:hypothetical protein
VVHLLVQRQTYGSEIWRGLDVFGLTPTQNLDD